MADNDTQSANNQTNTLEAAAKKTATSEKKATIKSSEKPTRNASKPGSKLAIFACVLALISILGLAGGGYWIFQQQQMLALSVEASTEKQLVEKQAMTQALLTKQQRGFDDRIANISQAIEAKNQQTINQLERTVNRLSATQPTDWLMHEAEYLIRVAGRTIWLEKDTSAAISLLTDANQRLKELKDPKFLHVRKIIHQDIERLKLLPILNVEEIVLTLMALSEQIDKLPLALAYLPESNDEEDVLVVSDNADDWQENLNKSWQRFLSDFITIRRRSASVEPLLTPVQKQNLMTNLKLKLGQAQWAASNGKESVYQQSLLETQTWLKTYFDMDSATNQQFSQSILNLTSERIFIEYPKELASLSAIRGIMKNKFLTDEPVIQTETVDDEKVSPVVDEINTSEKSEAIERVIDSPEVITPKKDEAII